jgi:hypothetical protein
LNMTMWKLALPVSLLAVGTVVGAAPSYAGTFSGVYSFDDGSVAATKTFVPVNPDTVNFGAFSKGTGVAVDPVITRGSSAYQATGWTSPDNTNPDSNKYFQFVVAPVAGNIMSITEVSFLRLSTDSGPRNWILRAFLGDPAAYDSASAIDLATSAITTGSSTSQNTITSPFQSPTAFQSVSQVTFRLYAYNALDSTGFFGVDNVKVEGTASPVPTPAAIPAIIGFGASLWRKRKQEGAAVA